MMTKDEAIKHLRSLADALEQGKTVQLRHPSGRLDTVTELDFLRYYLVKPEPREWWVESKYAAIKLHTTDPGDIPGTSVVHVREVLDE